MSSHSRPSSSRPLLLGVRPPHWTTPKDQTSYTTSADLTAIGAWLVFC